MDIFCTGCEMHIDARPTDGSEIYPHRPDLASLPFWKCDTCGNFVGCHHKTSRPTQPLGCIPTPELKDARKHIHSILDPIWKSGKMGRKEVYKAISNEIGYNYHTANIKSIAEARNIYRIVLSIKQAIDSIP